MKTQQGFIALISVIIISLVLILVATTLSFSSFYGRYNVLDAEMKEESGYLAEACADVALVNLARDSGYSPSNEVLTVGAGTCTIISAVASGSTKVVQVEVDYKHYFTNLTITVDADDLSVISWKETAV